MSKWYERPMRRLSRRERAKILASPTLRAKQRAWEQERVERLCAAFKDHYKRTIQSMLYAVPRPPAWSDAFPWEVGTEPIGRPVEWVYP